MSDTHDRNDDFTALDRITAGLPKELVPGRDLWPAIAARISEPAQHAARPIHWWQSPLPVAASLMIAASALTYALTRPGPGQAPGSGSERVPTLALDAGFLADRQRLGDLAEGRISELSPQMQSLLRENLAAIRGGIKTISAVLATDPDNSDLQDLLVSTYRQELQVMTELAKMPEHETRRIDL